MDFLNDLLEGEKKIKELRFLDKERMPMYRKGRRGIYDIACQTEEGEYFLVEVQNARQDTFKERALYYLSQTIANQGERGAGWQFDLKAVYGVFFLNFPLEGKLRSDGIIVDRDTGEQIIDKLRFIFIELPSFTKKEEECHTNQDLWLYTLKNMKTLERIPFKERKPVFKKLEEIADLASLSKEERRLYDAEIKAYRDRLAELGTAKRDGEKIGRRKGKIEVARNMKARGLDTAFIAETTGLSAEEVEKL